MNEETKDLSNEGTQAEENKPLETTEVMKEEVVETPIVETTNTTVAQEIPAEIPAEKKEEVITAPEQKEATVETKKEDKKSNKPLVAIVIILIIVLLGLLGFLVHKKFPNIYSKLNPNSKYGFDYNLNKVKSIDWGTVMTDKQIARATDVPQKFISSAKNPSWEWVLNDPKAFTEEVVCGSLIEEKILNEQNQDAKSLVSATVMICKDKANANKLFDSRKDEVKNIASQGSGIVLKELTDKKGIGTDAYYYLIERTTVTDESAGTVAGTDKFAGLIFKRGPYLVRFEESEKEGGAKLSDEKYRNALAKMLDKQLENSLSLF